MAVLSDTPSRNAKLRSLFRNFVKASADITIKSDSVEVRIGRRSNGPFLVNASCDEAGMAVPWHGNRLLRISFLQTEIAGFTSIAVVGNRGMCRGRSRNERESLHAGGYELIG